MTRRKYKAYNDTPTHSKENEMMESLKTKFEAIDKKVLIQRTVIVGLAATALVVAAGLLNKTVEVEAD